MEFNTLETPSKHDCRKKLLPDEPIFILRAKDPNSPKCIRKWVFDYLQRGGKNLNKVNEALETAREMEHFQKELKKQEKS